MVSKFENKFHAYTHIYPPEFYLNRFQNDEVTIDKYTITIKAMSREAINDLDSQKKQLRIAIQQGLKELREFISNGIDELQMEEAFNAIRPILSRLSRGKERRPRRKQVRLDRIWNAFRRKKSNVITLSDLVYEFQDMADPPKSASSAMGWLNNLLEESNTGYKIERVSAYRIIKGG